MSEEIRAILGEFREDIKTQLVEISNTNLAAFQSVQTTLGLHDKHIRRLWKQVRGSDPPENGNTDAKGNEADPPLDEIALEAHKLSSQHDLDLPALEARVLTGFANVEQRLAKVQGINENQTKAMGIKEDGGVSFFSHAKSAAIVIAALTGLVTAGAEACAVSTGKGSLINRPEPPKLAP
jgi:hypothetical protein